MFGRDDARLSPERRAQEALRGASGTAAVVSEDDLRVVAATPALDAAAGGRAAGRLLGEIAPGLAEAIRAPPGAGDEGGARLLLRVAAPGGAARGPDQAALRVPATMGGARVLLVAAVDASHGDAGRARADLAGALASLSPALGPEDAARAVVRGARVLAGAVGAFAAWAGPSGALEVRASDGFAALDAIAAAGGRCTLRAMPAGAPAWSPDPVWIEQREGPVTSSFPLHPARPGSSIAARWALVPFDAGGALALLGVAVPDPPPGAPGIPAAVLEVATRAAGGLRALVPVAVAPAQEPAAADEAAPRGRRGSGRRSGKGEPAQAPATAAAGEGASGERLAAMIAHDVRTPLSVIDQATALLLRGGRLGEEDLALLRRIARASHRIALLADEVIALARARAGGALPLRREPADLREVLERAVRDVQDAHPGRAVSLEAAGPCHGEWDASRLEQAVENLVQNALQHGAAGAAVSVSLACEPARARVEVRSAGTIAAELLPRLFEPFQPGAGSRGSGLGLFIVREIASAHGGTVQVRSDARSGTVFTLDLPRRERG